MALPKAIFNKAKNIRKASNDEYSINEIHKALKTTYGNKALKNESTFADTTLDDIKDSLIDNRVKSGLDRVQIEREKKNKKPYAESTMKRKASEMRKAERDIFEEASKKRFNTKYNEKMDGTTQTRNPQDISKNLNAGGYDASPNQGARNLLFNQGANVPESASSILYRPKNAKPIPKPEQPKITSESVVSGEPINSASDGINPSNFHSDSVNGETRAEAKKRKKSGGNRNNDYSDLYVDENKNMQNYMRNKHVQAQNILDAYREQIGKEGLSEKDLEGIRQQTASKIVDKLRMGSDADKAAVESELKDNNFDKVKDRISNNAVDIGVTDRVMGNKIPQKAAAGLGTVWLVSNMASNKGQLPNSQLYGQEQPYY